MKKKVKIDELNTLNGIELYYEPMQISGDDKTRRRELAELLTDAFLFFFSTYEVHMAHKSVLTKQLYAQLLADKVSEAVTKVTGIDSYMSDHIKEMSKQVVNTTFEKAEKPTDRPLENIDLDSDKLSQHSFVTPYYLYGALDTPSIQNATSGALSPKTQDEDGDNEYWLSYRRAEDIAKSEANTFLNYTDFLEAKESGKTKKTWLTMLDDKVRQTHNEVEGLTIGIDEVFVVGNSLMKFPHDLSESPDPKEVIGCRCSVEYK